MRKYSVAISKRTHAPFAPPMFVTWRASPQNTHGHLLYQGVNLNSKMKRHTSSTEPKNANLRASVAAFSYRRKGWAAINFFQVFSSHSKDTMRKPCP